MRKLLITESEKNRILKMYDCSFGKKIFNEQDQLAGGGGDSNLQNDIYWQSCDGNINILSDESKKLLRSKNNGDKIVYNFTQIPKDKSSNGEYDIEGCLGVYSTNDIFTIENYGDKKILRSVE